MTNVSTKVWRTPKASCYGAFAEATTQCKSAGAGDGVIFQPGDIPLHNVACS